MRTLSDFLRDDIPMFAGTDFVAVLDISGADRFFEDILSSGNRTILKTS